MKRLLMMSLLALPLAAGTCPRDMTDEERERRVTAASHFVLTMVNDFTTIYGPDWAADLDKGERLGILAACNGLTTALLFYTQVPPDVTTEAMAICASIREAPGYVEMLPPGA